MPLCAEAKRVIIFLRQQWTKYELALILGVCIDLELNKFETSWDGLKIIIILKRHTQYFIAVHITLLFLLSTMTWHYKAVLCLYLLTAVLNSTILATWFQWCIYARLSFLIKLSIWPCAPSWEDSLLCKFISVFSLSLSSHITKAAKLVECIRSCTDLCNSF